MIQLLRKDFTLIGKSYLIFLACTIILSVPCLYWGVDVVGVYIFSALLAFFIMVIGNLVSDQEQDATNFLLTLPVSKNVFVLSKYVSGLMIAVLNWLITSIVLFLIQLMMPISFQFTGLDSLVGLSWSIGIVVIIMSFILPVYYAFGNKAMRWLIIIPLLMASFSSQLVHSDFFVKIVSELTQYSTEFLLSIFLSASLAIYAISCVISLAVVRRKDF